MGGGGGRIREQKLTLSSNFALKRGGGGRNNEGGVTTLEYGTCAWGMLGLAWQPTMSIFDLHDNHSA